MRKEQLAALRAALERLAPVDDQSHDQAATLATWRALIDGQIALVSSCDVDGQRYLIARRNPPGARATAGLSDSEVKALRLRSCSTSYKVIADELGVSTAAAHGLVQAGMRKLGVLDETELPWLFRGHEVRAQSSE